MKRIVPLLKSVLMVLVILTTAEARQYDPVEGRFISKDPIGFQGGINPYAYVQNNPINYIDPYGLRSVLTVWQPSGWGASSFGHISTDINGTTYSFSPKGMAILPTTDYLQKNNFRAGVGAELNLTPDQEKAFEACLKSDQGSYGKSTNNCTSPPKNCLEKLGFSMGNSPLPVSLGNRVIDMGLGKGFEFYDATTPATGTSAPWAK